MDTGNKADRRKKNTSVETNTSTFSSSTQGDKERKIREVYRIVNQPHVPPHIPITTLTKPT